MKKIFKAMLAFGFLGLLVTSCSKAVPGVTKEEIKIGTCVATEGAYASVGVPYGSFYKAYVNYINKHLEDYPETDGRKLNLVSYDDKGDGAAGKTYIQRLINDDKVFALVGVLGTWNLVAAQNELETAGIPCVYFGTGSSVQMFDGSADFPYAEGDQKYMMGVQPLYKTEGRLMYLRCLTYDFGKKVNSIGVIYSASDDGTSLKAGIEMQAGLDTRTTGKPTIVYQQVSTDKAEEITAQINAVKDCDIIIAAANQAYFKGIYAAAQTNSSTKGTPILTTYVNIAPATVPESALETGASDIYGAAWVIFGEDATSSTEAARRVKDYVDFCKIVDSEFPENERLALKLSAYAMSSYIAVKMFLQGLAQVKKHNYDLTPANYLKAMEEAGPLPVAISGSVNYKANGERIGLDSLSFVKYQKPANITTGTLAASGSFVQVDPMKSIDTLFTELKK